MLHSIWQLNARPLKWAALQFKKEPGKAFLIQEMVSQNKDFHHLAC